VSDGVLVKDDHEPNYLQTHVLIQDIALVIGVEADV
jgi:hypothetical protein